MTRLLEARVEECSGRVARYALELDASEPYLQHHQPGGQPLLATVLGLEAMACVAEAALPGGAVELRGVRIGHACVFAPGAGGKVQVGVRSQAGEPGVQCEVHSLPEGAPMVLHFEGRALPRQAVGGDVRALDIGPWSVTSAEVYRHFFHGPAFRVVAGAQWLGGRTLVARMAGRLPALRRGMVARTTFAPRVLEFGLQAAGLLLLACTGEMRIPSGIDRVAVDAGDEAAWQGGAIARATLREGGLVDVRLASVPGGFHGLVEGYRTVPLPFGDDHHTRAALVQALRSKHSAAKGRGAPCKP